jgi:uroporphyrinogen III methyltransferase/synthase
VLVPLSERARDVLVAGLRARGARVEAPVAYRTVAPPGLAERYAELARAGFDLLVFASPSAVGNLAAAVGEPTLRGRAAAVIGPVTEEAAHKAGLDVRVRAEPSTASGLVAALARRYGRAG